MRQSWWLLVALVVVVAGCGNGGHRAVSTLSTTASKTYDIPAGSEYQQMVYYLNDDAPWVMPVLDTSNGVPIQIYTDADGVSLVINTAVSSPTDAHAICVEGKRALKALQFGMTESVVVQGYADGPGGLTTLAEWPAHPANGLFC